MKKIALSFLFGLISVVSVSAANNPSAVVYKNTIEDLENLGAASSQYSTAYVKYYSTSGDGGGGELFWDPTSTATPSICGPFQANGVTTGRWVWNSGTTLRVSQCGGSSEISDNGVAINAAISTVEAGYFNSVSINTGLEFWTFTTPIINTNNVPVVVEGSGLNYTGSGSDAITIGSPTDFITTANPQTSVWVVKRNSINYSDEHAGIVIQNLFQGNFKIKSRNFQTGIKIYGQNNAGSAYINLQAAQILNSEKGIYFLTNTGGFTNQITVEAMTISNSSSTSDSNLISCLVFEGNTIHPINGNTFNHPSCELNNTGSGGVAFLETEGTASGNIAQNNLFDFLRMESSGGSGGEFLIWGAKLIQKNVFRNIGYIGTMTAPFLFSPTDSIRTGLVFNQYTFTDSPLTGYTEPTSLVTVGRPNIVTRSNSGTVVMSPARGKWYETPNTFVNETAGASVGTNDIIISSGGVGFFTFINTSNSVTDILRKLHFTVNALVTGGRFCVKAYDKAGTEITSADDVQFSDLLTYDGSFNCWLSGVDITTSSNYLDVMYSTRVGFIALGVVKGSANADFTFMNVEGPRGSNSIVLTNPYLVPFLGSTLPLLDSSSPVSVTTPNSTDAKGTVAWSIGTTTTGNPPGWISDGSVWHAMANNP